MTGSSKFYGNMNVDNQISFDHVFLLMICVSSFLPHIKNAAAIMRGECSDLNGSVDSIVYDPKHFYI